MGKIKDNKLILSILLMGIMICTILLLSSCYAIYYFHDITEEGYTLGKIIYTNDYQKYLEGRTIAEGVSNLSSGPSGGLWILETDTQNKYDIILTTVPVEYEGNGGSISLGEAFEIGYSSEIAKVNMEGYGQRTLFDNSYIFSGVLGCYTPGGPIDCADPRCICPYDPDDSCLCWRRQFEEWVVDEEKTEQEVKEYYAPLYCEVCNYIDVYEDDDGQFHYNIGHNCSCRFKLFHDGTWSREHFSWMQIFVNGMMSSVRFDELVLDGYDFGVLYNFLETYDYSEFYTNWEGKQDLSKFDHMFSDLPVEKITIKNVIGLGDRAKDLSGMFENCVNLRTIEFGNLFENCKPTNISKMFYNCPNLQNVDLTTLDTSEVTNMSEMFAIGTSKISLEERKEIVEDYINTVEVPKDSNLDDDTVYTVESYADVYDMRIEEVYLNIAAISKLNYPVTYNECTLGAYDISFIDFYNMIQDDPTQVGLASGEYTMKDVVNYVETTAAAYGVNAVYEADLLTNNRRDYINYAINNLLVPIENLPNQNGPYTIEDIATLNGQTVEKTLLTFVATSGLNIPISIEEAVMANFEMTLEEAVVVINADPSIVGLAPKEGGESYSIAELIEIYTMQLESEGFIVLTAEEIETYYTSKEVTPRGVLKLGGENSKFVINEDTNVYNIFGDFCYFATVITPNVIGDGVELLLKNTYTHNNIDIVTTITSADSSKTFVYKEIFADEPEDPVVPEDPENPTEPTDPVVPDTTPTTPEEPEEEKKDEEDNDNIAVIVIAATGGTAVVGGAGVTTVKLIRRKKKPMTIKGQKL